MVDELEAGEIIGPSGLRRELHRVFHAPVRGVGRIDHKEVEDAVGHRERLAGQRGRLDGAHHAGRVLGILDQADNVLGFDGQDKGKAERYQEEQTEIQKEAKQKEAEAKSNFHQHETFAHGVTMFQIAIAIAAISALTAKRRFWIVSLVFGAVGCVFLVLGLVNH